MIARAKLAEHRTDEVMLSAGELAVIVWQSDPTGFRIVRCVNSTADGYAYVIQAADGTGASEGVNWRVLSVYDRPHLDKVSWDQDWGPLLSALATALLRSVDPVYMRHTTQLW
jgi:hypothetical protein